MNITLSTINEFSLDAIIQHIAHHLILQNARAHNGGCVYRDAKTGNKCAVGCIISDEEYTPEFEKMGILNRVFDAFNIEKDRRYLLDELQRIHDRCMVLEWPDKLIRIAYNKGLDTFHLKTIIDVAVDEREGRTLP